MLTRANISPYSDNNILQGGINYVCIMLHRLSDCLYKRRNGRLSLILATLFSYISYPYFKSVLKG